MPRPLPSQQRQRRVHDHPEEAEARVDGPRALRPPRRADRRDGRAARDRGERAGELPPPEPEDLAGVRVRVDDEEDAEERDRKRDEHARAEALAEEEHRHQAAPHRRGVVEERGHADAAVLQGHEVEHHGDAAEDAAVEDEVEALHVERGAQPARHEEDGEEAEGHPHHGHLRAGEARRGDLRREGHGPEHHRRGEHEEEGAVRVVFW